MEFASRAGHSSAKRSLIVFRSAKSRTISMRAFVLCRSGTVSVVANPLLRLVVIKPALARVSGKTLLEGFYADFAAFRLESVWNQ
jgi:hypothetical protein